MPLHRTILLGVVLALAACQSVNTTQPGVVGVSRTQSMLVSSKQINDSAQKAYAQTTQQAAQNGAQSRPVRGCASACRGRPADPADGGLSSGRTGVALGGERDFL